MGAVVLILCIKRLEYLNAMILSVSDQNISLAVHSNSFETLELSIVLSPPAKCSKECSIRIENLDSVVSGISNKDETLLIDSHTPAIQILVFIYIIIYRKTNLGNLNCPSSVPSDPKVVMTFPFTSNICSL